MTYPQPNALRRIDILWLAVAGVLTIALVVASHHFPTSLSAVFGFGRETPTPTGTPSPTPTPPPSASSGPTHVLDWSFYGPQATDVPASWMAAHVSFVEISGFSTDPTSQSSYGVNFKNAGGQYALDYNDTLFEYGCVANGGTGYCSWTHRYFGADYIPEDDWLHSASPISTSNRMSRVSAVYPNENIINPGSTDAQSRFYTKTSADANTDHLDYLFCDDVGNDAYPGNQSPWWNFSPNITYEYGSNNAQYQHDEDAMVNSGGRPCVINNRGPWPSSPNYNIPTAPNLYLSTTYADPNVVGAVTEGCFLQGPNGTYDTLTGPNQGVGASWPFEANTLWARTQHQHFAVCLAFGNTTYEIPERLYLLASWWLTYDPKYSVLWDYIPSPNDSGGYQVRVYPEEGIVPTSPRQSPGSGITTGYGDIGTLQTSTGAFAREFAACYQGGSLFGKCAAVVNPSASASVNMPTLSQTYTQHLVLDAYNWWSGGTATWSAGIPTSLGPTTAVILR